MTKSNKNTYIIIIVIAILILIILPVYVPNIIDTYDNTNLIQVKENWMGFLGSYLGSIVAGIFTVLAVLLSFEISKEHSENAVLRENALIVYYDLVLGFKDLLRIYSSFVISLPVMSVPSKMFFSKEWIKNVSTISSIYGDMSSIERLYLMYGDLEMLDKEIQIYCEFTSNCSTGNNLKKVKELSTKLVEKYFKEYDATIIESIITGKSDIMDYLKDEYKSILINAKNRVEKV